VSSGGVGLRANGYCFASRFPSECCWMRRGGYDRLVVVVVVTVLVSTHSASSICSLEVRRDIVSSPSSQSTETSWLLERGRRVSTPPCMGTEFEVKGLGDVSDTNFWRETLLLCIETARRLGGGLVGGSMMSAVKVKCVVFRRSLKTRGGGPLLFLPLSLRTERDLDTRPWTRRKLEALHFHRYLNILPVPP
jgi:hypothetical protein